MKRFNVKNFTLSFINPILGFFSSTYDIMRLKDASLFFSFSLALVAVYFPLMYDTSASFFKFYYPDITSYTSLYTIIPIFLKKNFGIDFYYFIFFNVFFVSFVWSKIVLFIFSQYKGKYISVFILIILTLTFNYRDLMDINRTIFAYSLLFYYIFLIKNKNIITFLFFAIIASLTHNSALILIMIYMFSFIPAGYRLNFTLLCFSLTVGLFLPNLIFNFEKIFIKIPVIGEIINFYIFGERFGVQVFSTATFLKKISNVFFVFTICALSIYSIKKEGKDKVLQFLILLGCTELCFLGFVTLFERINLAFNFLFIYIFLKNIGLINKCLIVFLVFFKSFILYSFIYIPIFIGNHTLVLENSIKNEIIIKPFYYPTILLLDIHNNGYSDKIIRNHSKWKD